MATPNPEIYCKCGVPACQEIRFEIISVDEVTRSALVEPQAWPVGCTAVDLPGILLVEGVPTSLEVCDPLGCYFNEPSSELTGRTGWARYMQPGGVAFAGPCQEGAYDPAEPQWEVFALCCAVPACEVF